MLPNFFKNIFGSLFFLRFNLGLWVIFFFGGCNHVSLPKEALWVKEYPSVFPSYTTDIVIPFNIAPLNFKLLNPAKRVYVGAFAFNTQKQVVDSLIVKGRGSDINFPLKKWKKLLACSKGSYIEIRVFVQEKELWIRYQPLRWYVAKEAIDPYLMYRLSISEDYTYNHITMEQRSLENFESKELLDNYLMENNCMNCHASHKNDANQMLVHLRGKISGTLIIRNGKAEKIDIPAGYPKVRLVYPSWYPDGSRIAFSTNRVFSRHFSNGLIKTLHSLDTLGDIVVYNIDKNTLYSSEELTDSTFDDVFPCWSANGRTLYFCRTISLKRDDFAWGEDLVDSLRANLMQISYDPVSETFSNLKLAYDFSKDGKSVSMPQLSPDGKFMIVSVLPNTTFPVLHKGDLYLIRLPAGEDSLQGSSTVELQAEPIEILNTPFSETFHNFSSNGRWMVFSSNRMNGASATPFIAYFDTKGIFHKPFALPQKSGNFYKANLKAFLFPYFTVNTCTYNPRKLAKIAKGKSKFPNMSYFEKDFSPNTKKVKDEVSGH